MIADKLKPGDEIRVIAPSRNLTEVCHVAHDHAVDFYNKQGFNLTFSKKIRNWYSFSLSMGYGMLFETVILRFHQDCKYT